jgi:hypothetical protein
MGLWLSPIESVSSPIASEFGGSSKPSTADPAPKHNNKPQQPTIFIANEWTRQMQSKTTIKQATISLQGGGGICKFVACLVFISFYSYNTYFKPKLHQQLDYYVLMVDCCVLP